MDKDELLRLKQITGLAELFLDKEFSEAWATDVAESAIAHHAGHTIESINAVDLEE